MFIISVYWKMYLSNNKDVEKKILWNQNNLKITLENTPHKYNLESIQSMDSIFKNEYTYEILSDYLFSTFKIMLIIIQIFLLGL